MDQAAIDICCSGIEEVVHTLNNLSRATGTDRPISIMVIFDGYESEEQPHVVITNATDVAVIRELRKTYNVSEAEESE